jgi:hypothetical protein
MEFKAFGKVISTPLTNPNNVTLTRATPDSNEFVLDDGGIKIRVFCPGNAVAVGEWHRVTGKIMPATSLYPSGELRHMRLHATTDELE